MDESNLIAAFELLDDFLTEGKAAPVWLVVGGGSALLAQRFGSRQTKDVDVMALREWDGNVVSAHPLPDAVKRAAASVVEDLACLNASRTELEILLRWVLQNTHETSTHPKIPNLLQELGHADLISRFA